MIPDERFTLKIQEEDNPFATPPAAAIQDKSTRTDFPLPKEIRDSLPIKRVMSNYNHVIYNLNNLNPKVFSEKYKMAKKADVTVDLVQSLSDDVFDKAQRKEMIKAIENEPSLIKYYQSRDNVGVSRDDVDGLLQIAAAFKTKSGLRTLRDEAIKFIPNLGIMLQNMAGYGFNIIDSGMRETGQDFYNWFHRGGKEAVFGDDKHRDMRADRFNAWWDRNAGILNAGKLGDLIFAEADRQQMILNEKFPTSERVQQADMLGDLGIWTNPEFLISTSAQALASMVPVVGAFGKAARFGRFAQSIAGGFAGAELAASYEYKENIADGMSKDKALKASYAFGVGSAVLNSIGAGALLNKIGVGSKFRAVGKNITSGLIEMATEYLEEAWGGVVGGAARHGVSPDAVDYAIDRARQGLAVIPASFIIGNAVRAGATYGEYINAKQAQADQNFYEALMDSTGKSKTFQRLPDKAREYIALLKEDAGGAVENVYVDAELFQQAFTDTQEAVSRATAMGVTDLNEAAAAGKEMSVPLEVWASTMAGTNEGVALRRDVRFNEDGYSINEAEAYLKEYNTLINDTVAQIEEQTQTEIANASATSDIHSSMVNSLRAAGYKKDAAEANAAVFAAMVRTIHSRYGEEMGRDLAGVAELLVPDIIKGGKPGQISVNEMHPSITAKIRKAGGIKPESVTALGYNTKEFTQEFGFGLLNRNGAALDELAETLIGESVISPAPSGTDTVDHLLGELRKNVHARRNFDPEAYMEAQAEMYQSTGDADADIQGIADKHGFQVSKHATKSGSEYYKIRSGEQEINVRVSDHELPGHYKDTRENHIYVDKENYADRDLEHEILTALKNPQGALAKNDIARVYAGEAMRRPITLGSTPQVYSKYGFEPKELSISGRAISAVKGMVDEKELSRLPEELERPVGIFKTDKADAIVIVTRLRDKYGNQLAFQINKDTDSNFVNNIGRLTGGHQQIKQWIDKGLMLFPDNKKGLDSSGLAILIASGRSAEANVESELSTDSNISPDGKDVNRKDELFQTRNTIYKGSTSIFTVGEAKPLVKLFSSKDESTFIHETAHIYFQYLEQMEARPNAPQGMLDDMDIVRRFVGNDGSTPLSRDQHEKLADAMESYFIEGKSPSAGLTRIFHQFAAWIKALYDRARRQKVKLSPEVRGLFDRIFATDLEIEEVRNFYGKQTDFTADLKDMDAEQLADYQKKLEKANVTERDKNIRRHARAYKIAMAGDIQENAERAVSYRQVYRTIDAIKESGGVNGADVEEAFGVDVRKALSKKGLLAPDDAIAENTPLLAEIVIKEGYESEAAFVNEVLAAPTKKQAIAERVKELHADAEEMIATGLQEMEMMAEAGKGPAADQDYHSPERMVVIVAEQAIAAQRIQASERRANKPRVAGEVELARRAMRERIYEMKTAEAIQHYPFSRAERKASDLAKKAIHKEDYAEAARQKRRELLNHAGVLEAVLARKDVDKMLTRVKKILGQKSVSNEGKAIIERIAARYGFVNSQGGESLAETAARIAGKHAGAPALADWAKGALDSGIPIVMSELALSGEVRHWRELTVNEMKQVVDDIISIKYVDMIQHNALKDGKRIARKLLIAKLKAIAEKNHGSEDLKKIQSMMSKGEEATVEMLIKAESLFRALDGETAGEWMMTFIDPLSRAASEEAIRRKTEGNRLRELFIKHYGKFDREWSSPWRTRWEEKIFIPEIGEPLTKEMIVAVALNVGNSDNLNKLMEGHGWNRQQVEAIIDKLDKRDWEFVQDVWDYVDSFREEWFAYGKKMTGVEPQRVEAEPFTTKYGQKMKGGYYPLGWDARLSNQDYKNELEALGLQPSSGGTFHEIARVKQGSLTQRKKTSGGRAVNLSFNVLTQHVSEVVHAVTHGETIAELSILLQNKELGKVLKNTLGAQAPQQLKDWLLAVAKQGRKELDWIERGARFIRTKTTFLRLGFSLATGVKQFTGLAITVSHKEIGLKQTLKGMNLVFGTGGDYAELGKRVDFIYEKSAFMRTRVSGFDRDINDAMSGLKAPNVIEQAGFMVIGYAQLTVDLPTWMAAYDLAINKKGFDDDKAVAFADSIVRQTQGSGRTMDLSKIQRGNELHKLLTMFYSFHNTLLNMAYIHKKDKDMPKLMAFIFWAMIVQPIMTALISFDLPDEDKEEGWLEWAAKTAILEPVGMVPFLRDIVGGINYSFRGTPAEALPEAFTRLIKAAGKAIETGEYERMITPAMQTFVPMQGIRTYNAMVDLLNGDPDKAFMMFVLGKDIDK